MLTLCEQTSVFFATSISFLLFLSNIYISSYSLEASYKQKTHLMLSYENEKHIKKRSKLKKKNTILGFEREKRKLQMQKRQGRESCIGNDGLMCYIKAHKNVTVGRIKLQLFNFHQSLFKLPSFIKYFI